MLVVCSANGRVGIEDAVAVLRRGGSAVEAVEAGILPVEANPDDHSVGYSGYPNLVGEVELDASIMDGRTLSAGAVGAVRGYLHPISIARKVMEELPHVMVVGAGAERFAAEVGFTTTDLLTPEARAYWQRLFGDEAPTSLGRQGESFINNMRRWAARAADPQRPNETVNFIAQDRDGQLAVGVSTSGWSWKYPGRLGDSPVIGAGNYADSRYGAAACTGRGEMAIRAGTARSVVLYLKMGLPLVSAGEEAMRDLHALVDAYYGVFSLITVDRDGNHAAFSNSPGGTYVVWTEDLGAPEERPRIHVS